jgi:hypothetical protein
LKLKLTYALTLQGTGAPSHQLAYLPTACCGFMTVAAYCWLSMMMTHGVLASHGIHTLGLSCSQEFTGCVPVDLSAMTAAAFTLKRPSLRAASMTC